MEESVETVRLVSHERVQQRTADTPRPQMAEETVKMVGSAPRERVLVSASGRPLNLGSAVDHHFFLLACSFTNQVLAQLDVLRLCDGTTAYKNDGYLLPVKTR